MVQRSLRQNKDIVMARPCRTPAVPVPKRACGGRRTHGPAAFDFTFAFACLLPAAVAAQPVADAAQQVVVTATRVEALPFDVPASITRVDGSAIRDGRLQVSLSESLGGVPGLLARDRQNYAQDVQLSVRGFGARSSFGIRGVRLYVDGIPATLPDGQGQLSNVDLGSAERIEVLRGPGSALYGNASGGVVQVFTEEGRGRPTLSPSVAAGSDGVARVGLKLAGADGSLGYLLDLSGFKTRGAREHSAAERRLANAKLSWKPGAADKLTVVLNSVALPKAQDPLGLSRAQFDSDPQGVDPSALAFNTRKTVDQTQLGVVYERTLDPANALRLLVYGGHRNTEQFQAIPVASQSNALHPGGVIQLGRDYQGVDLRWTLRGTLADAPFTLVAGLSSDSLDEHRLGFQNFIGTTLGVEGPLRRDEDNRVRNLDPYVQAGWRLGDAVRLNLGLRRSRVNFDSHDRYIVGANGDDSGSARYGATLPVAGLLVSVAEGVNLYASAGRGFETPTLNELAYRADGGTGLNFGLQASRSRSVEIGLKARSARWGDIDLALFDTGTSDEIVTLSNVGGRSTYKNAGRTQRRGAEAAWSAELPADLRLQLAWAWLDARYRDAFATCVATPCATPTFTIAAGNLIPGVARSTVFGSLAWGGAQGWRAGLEWRASARVPVNDANTDAAAGWATASARVGYALAGEGWTLTGFARIDNLFARRYAGSVIVNEGNGRYFEPAPGRSLLAGVSAGFSY
jgi:iron complex outermembrane receptor protein